MGLSSGLPALMASTRATRKLRKWGEHRAIAALEVAAAGGVWFADRARDPAKRVCSRCSSGAAETPLHRYFECQATKDLEAKDEHGILKASAYIYKLARERGRLHNRQCLWARGFIPTDMASRHPLLQQTPLGEMDGLILQSKPAAQNIEEAKG